MDDSPEVEINYTGQVHLKPKDPKPYWQYTQGKEPFVLGDTFTAWIVSCSGDEDITTHVDARRFSDKGVEHFAFMMAYLPTDYGGEPVYLRFDMAGETLYSYYSNYFLLTDNDIHLTTRIDYFDTTRQIISDEIVPNYQSVRLSMYFKNFVSANEVDTYYQITQSQIVNPRILEKEQALWTTTLWDGWTFRRLVKAFRGPVYLDFVRQYLTAGMEYNERVGLTNISENQFTTDPDPDDTFTVIDVIIGVAMIDFLASNDDALASSTYLASTFSQ